MNKVKITVLLITLLLFGSELFSQEQKQVGGRNTCQSNVRPKTSNANTPTVTQNANGEQEVIITVAGDYTFVSTVPKKSGENTINVPMRGIKIGLAKRPSGKILLSAKTNSNGEVTFKNVQPGTYIFVDVPLDNINSEPVKRSKN